jgi:hypothetical protein
MLVSGGAAPLNLNTGECALPTYNKVCISDSDRAAKYISDYLRSIDQEYKYISMSDMIDKLKTILGVESESAIWQHPKIRSYIGANFADKILSERYKPEGPANSTKLLNNYNIDDTLELWGKNSQKLFGKKYFHIPYQMIDFMDVGSELSYLDIEELKNQKYDCFGVVLNTDVSAGGGKHWFCIYGDISGDGTRQNPYRIEYFNSSGNPPMDEVIVWMENTKYKLMKYNKKYCEIIRSAPIRLQSSNTECGVWSLIYIRSRLEGKPVGWFYTVNTTCDDMIRLRKLIFR